MELNQKLINHFWLTIVIALKNNSDELDKTLLSISEQSNQINSKILVLIMDSNSEDYPYRIYKKFNQIINIRFISEFDNGIYYAWNRSIKLLNSKWVTFFGAGDLFLPNALIELEKFTIEHQSYTVVSSKSQISYRNGIKRIAGKRYIFDEFRCNFTTNHSGLLYDVDIFRRHGNFNLNYKIASDYEFLLRIGKYENFGFLNHLISFYPYGGISSKSLLPLIEVYKIRKINKLVPWHINLYLLLRGILAHYYHKFN